MTSAADGDSDSQIAIARLRPTSDFEADASCDHGCCGPRIKCGAASRVATTELGVHAMSTISTMRTGHHRLPDGSLLRVDIELGRWVGSLYTADMRVKTQIVGGDVEVHAWADRAKQRNGLARHEVLR